MAEVAGLYTHHDNSGTAIDAGNMDYNFGPVEMRPNPDFRFPMQPAQSSSRSSSNSRRPVSMQLASPTLTPTLGHAHHNSVSALPNFSFNASDTSGLKKEDNAPTATDPISPISPTKSLRHHRRGASEFIGGDGRFGVSGLMSTSPTKKQDALPVPITSVPAGSPAGRRGHAHRRSAAISSHDLSAILQPKDVNAPLQNSSAPVTPIEHSSNSQCPQAVSRSSSETKVAFDTSEPQDPFVQSSTEPTRPPSRPRVGFSDNVEYIPRPLSTISSETESSFSTVRGHSVTNSISSMMSLASASPSPARVGRRSLSASNVNDSAVKRSSVEVSKSVEREGQWFKGEGKRPLSESAAASPNLSIATDSSSFARPPSRKRNFLGLDRRRSEPLISAKLSDHTRLSSVSLQEPADLYKRQDGGEHHPKEKDRSSARKVKEWARAFVSSKPKESKRPKSMDFSVLAAFNTHEPQPQVETPATELTEIEIEPDLDALFGQSPEPDVTDNVRPRIEVHSAPPSFYAPLSTRDSDNMSPVIDLDAALGPYGTPSMSWETRSSAPARRPLHSSRLNRDFMGPGMHYHRRTESAPALVPFDLGRSSSPGQSPMADVFEEDEEEDMTTKSAGRPKTAPAHENEPDEELGIGIQVVDTDVEQSGPGLNWGFEDGLGIQTDVGLGRPVSPFSGLTPRLATPPIGRRTSSVLEDTILEETSPIEIVEGHEEPRTSSVTKSSDSSDTPTIMANTTELALPLPTTQPPVMTPSSYQASTFSSPDFSRRQGSFDMPPRLGTSASSMTDNRTISSFATGEPGPEVRMSVDDVPSLTSSRSTMVTMHNNGSRRDFSDRSASTASTQQEQNAERRRKRSSIQSLSKLMGARFGDSKTNLTEVQRPQTSATLSVPSDSKKKKEHRLSKWMFWKSKNPSRSAS